MTIGNFSLAPPDAPPTPLPLQRHHQGRREEDQQLQHVLRDERVAAEARERGEDANKGVKLLSRGMLGRSLKTGLMRNVLDKRWAWTDRS